MPDPILFHLMKRHALGIDYQQWIHVLITIIFIGSHVFFIINIRHESFVNYPVLPHLIKIRVKLGKSFSAIIYERASNILCIYISIPILSIS